MGFHVQAETRGMWARVFVIAALLLVCVLGMAPSGTQSDTEGLDQQTPVQPSHCSPSQAWTPYGGCIDYPPCEDTNLTSAWTEFFEENSTVCAHRPLVPQGRHGLRRCLERVPV